MIRMLIYCDDPSHTAKPVGPIITDPDLVLPGDVFIADELEREDLFADDDGIWISKSLSYRDEEGRFVHGGGGVRDIVDDGTVLPPFNYQTKEQQQLASQGRTRETWAKRCRRCGQRGGRWKFTDLDAVLGRLAAQGVTGISLRALDVRKHTH